MSLLLQDAWKECAITSLANHLAFEQTQCVFHTQQSYADRAWHEAFIL